MEALKMSNRWVWAGGGLAILLVAAALFYGSDRTGGDIVPLSEPAVEQDR